MLRFFRNIRKQLIQENKTFRYLKYAFGEIILVMVGILLALQVNNWNEARKNEVLELDLLVEIRSGLVVDVRDITYNISAHEKIINSQQILLRWLQSDRPYIDSLSDHFSIVNGSTVFVSNDGPYETLKDIGIRLIKNKALRDKITTVYDLDFDYYKDHVVMYNELVFEGWKNGNKPYFEATKFKFSNPENVMVPLDKDLIRTDHRYRYQLETMTDFNIFYVNRIMKRAKTNAEALITMIDAELESR